jgi:hypothetical protein
LIHSKPVRSDFPIKVLVTHYCLCQTRSESLGAALGDIVLHGVVDEPAALARLRQPVNGLHR